MVNNKCKIKQEVQGNNVYMKAYTCNDISLIIAIHKMDINFISNHILNIYF